MNEKYEAIEKEIEELKMKKDSVKGTDTEVYSRIVGYYRSVKNWNLGKKEEYKNRQVFTKLSGRDAQAENAEAPEIQAVPASEAKTPGKISTYLYFYRTTCPNCPAMKEVLNNLSFKGEDLNVDMERGIQEASRLSVFACPTVIFTDKDGIEVFRTSKPSDVANLFNLNEASA